MTGQITRQSQFGNMIYEITKHPEIKNIVDVGTWSGLGTTKCIIDGLVDSNKQDYKLISVELYPEQYQHAIQNLKPYLNENIKLLNGRLIEYDEAFWFDHSTINFQNDAHARLWYQKDMNYLKTQPNVFNQLPESIDLLVLDGGEYTTYPEYIKLKDRTRVIALDDTNILKCKRIRQELLDSGYSVVYDAPQERNGCTIFRIK